MAEQPRNLDPFKDHDLDELSDDEKTALAYARSNVSLQDYDPNEVEAHEKVVELADRSSHIVGDLVDHPDPVIAADAQAVKDGNYPGGPNYPNGPAEGESKSARKEAQAEKKADAPKSQQGNQ